MRVCTEFEIPERDQGAMRSALADGDYSWVWEIVSDLSYADVREV